MGWDKRQISDQTGRVAIVTGANSGIGFETALALSDSGGHVVMACRSLERGDAALERLRGSGGPGTAELILLDLSSLESVRAFASAFLSAHDRLDLLINNAGVMRTPKATTAEGFELQFGTNHLGHFALTGLLIDRLAATPGSRVVNVSSLAHRIGRIDFDNLRSEKSYGRMREYAQSKLANLLFTRELDRRLAEAGIDAIATAAHPGISATNLVSDSRAMRSLAPVFAQHASAGALPTLLAATGEVDGNGYIGPGGVFELKGLPKAARRTRRAKDDAVAARLWAVSQDLTGVRYLDTDAQRAAAA